MAVSNSQKFRILDGDIYVAKWGSDANPGTIASPKLTLAAAETAAGADAKKIVVGEGFWQEDRAFLYDILWYGDGLVIFDGTGVNFFQFTQGSNEEIHNIIFNNYNNSARTLLVNADTYFYFCVFNNSDPENNSASDAGVYTNCVFYNILLRGAVSTRQFFDVINCVFVNCDNQAIWRDPINGIIYNCVFYNCPNMDFPSTIINGSPADWNYNNIFGTVTIDGTAGRDLTWIKANTNHNQDSIDDNPLFEDLTNLDFTLQSLSTLLQASEPKNGFKLTIGAFQDNVISKTGGELFDNATSTTNAKKTGNIVESNDGLAEWALDSEIIALGKTTKLGKIIPYLSSTFNEFFNIYIKHGLSSGSLSGWLRVKTYSEQPKSDGTYGNDDTNSVDANLKDIVCSYLQLRIEASVGIKIGGLAFEFFELKYFEEAFTKTAYAQQGSGQGNFIGESYKCLLLPQPDSEIDAATTGAYKIQDGTVYTYDEIVAIATASPASGNLGHVELTYSNSNPAEHNIEKVEVTVDVSGATDRIKTLYTFNS